MTGVYKRGEVWWVRYRFNGKLVRQRVGRDLTLAEGTMKEIRRRIEDGRHEVKAKADKRTFAEMMAEYLVLKADKRSLDRDRTSFKNLGPFFGETYLDAITQAEVKT